MVNLITGKAGSGKTITIYDTLISKASENNIIITNPQSVEAYELFLARNHIAATVISINDAPAAISSMVGYTYKTPASTIEKIAIVSDIIRTSNGLSIIKPAHYSTGIVDKILNAITDLKKERITGKQLLEWEKTSPYGGLFGKKISDLAYIMNKYDNMLAEKDMITEEDLLWQISDYMEETGVVLCDNLFIDTLPGYLTSTICFICSLLEAAQNVYIAFRTTNSRAHDFFAFSDSLDAMNAVKDYCEANGCPIKAIKATRKTDRAAVTNLRSGIDIIAENFFDRSTKLRSDDSSVKLCEANTNQSEAGFVCSEIKRLISAGAAYDDIVVASPLIEDYFPIIQQMFFDHDIPYHYFKNDNLAHTQLFNMVKIMLDCCWDGITLERIMQAAQINFLSFSDEELAVIDSFNKRFGDDMSTALANCQKYNPDDYTSVCSVIERVEENIQAFIDDMSAAKTVQDYLSTIVNVLVAYNANESLYTDITKLYGGNEYQMCNDVVIIWNSLIDVINTIDKILGSSSMSIEDFAQYFEKICQNKKLVNNNKYFGEVRIVSLPDVANDRPKHLFVMGCNEGSLIKLPDETFFAPNEKHILNDDLKISIPENEYFINKKIADIYSSFTTPYNTLTLSWALFNGSCNPMERASIIDSIYNIFQSNVIKEADYSKAMGEADFLEFLCGLSECKFSGTPISKKLKHQFNKYSEHPMFKKRLSAALHNMDVHRDRFNTPKEIPGKDVEISVTRAERYNECPFKHYVTFALSPREQKMFEETQANKGTYYHAVFCAFYTYVKDNNIDYEWLTRHRDDFDEIINKIIDEVQNDHNENVLNSSAKLKFTSEKMRETAIVSVWNSLRQIVAGGFRPEEMEYNIGKSALLAFDLSNGHHAFVTGIADRIDTVEWAGDKYARIIDYKSGDVTFSKEKADLGVQLQLPLYMSALRDYQFGGMYYFHVHNPYSSDDIGSDTLKNFKLSGPTLSENGIPEQSDVNLGSVGCSVVSEIVNVSKTTKDEYGKRSDILTKAEADEMMSNAQQKYLEAAEGIISGNSIAAPVKTKTFSACKYCKYKALCSK